MLTACLSRPCRNLAGASPSARLIGSGDIYELQGLIGRCGYPTAYSAIKYLLGSHDQIFNQWVYDDRNRAWRWDKPGGGGLRENRYFVEKIGGAADGRAKRYARAQARPWLALHRARGP